MMVVMVMLSLSVTDCEDKSLLTISPWLSPLTLLPWTAGYQLAGPGPVISSQSCADRQQLPLTGPAFLSALAGWLAGCLLNISSQSSQSSLSIVIFGVSSHEPGWIQPDSISSVTGEILSLNQSNLGHLI